MKNILIPTDFSETANNAFLYALQLANHLDVKLYVLYSYLPPIISSTHAGHPEMVAEVYEQVELSKFGYFKKNVPDLHKLAKEHNLDDSKLVFLFEQGTVVSSVRKVLSEEDIRLVVMGTRGASGLTQQFIGTNTSAVVKNVKTPVLIVPEKATYSPIKNIAFTTLFRDKDEAPLRDIFDISQLLHARLYCLHVMDNAADPTKPLLYSDSWGKKLGNENLNFVFLEKTGSVEDCVNRFIKENNIDMLTIVKRNRNFFDRLVSSSLSNKFAFHSETPVLVFHEEV